MEGSRIPCNTLPLSQPCAVMSPRSLCFVLLPAEWLQRVSRGHCSAAYQISPEIYIFWASSLMFVWVCFFFLSPVAQGIYSLSVSPWLTILWQTYQLLLALSSLPHLPPHFSKWAEKSISKLGNNNEMICTVCCIWQDRFSEGQLDAWVMRRQDSEKQEGICV